MLKNILAVAIVWGGIAFSDVIYLKDGSIIKGKIIGIIPGEQYKIKTGDGSIFVFGEERVERIEFEEEMPKQPPLPLITPPPAVTPPPVAMPSQPLPFSINLWLGTGFPSMKEVNDAVKEFEDWLINYHNYYGFSYTSQRTWIERGMNIGGDMVISPKGQNVKLLGRVEYISCPEFGLDFEGKAIKAKIHYKPSLLVIAGGLSSGNFSLTQKLFFNGEGLLGYGFGNVKISGLKESTNVKKGSLFLSGGANLKYKVSPKFSIEARGGYKRCSPKVDIPKDYQIWDKNGKEFTSMTFNFSGFYIGCGLKFALK